MKRYRRVWLIIGLSVLTIAGLIRFGEIDVSLKTLSQVSTGWFLLALLFFYISVVARGLRWQRILSALDYPVGRVYGVALVTAGLFTSSILPARAGDLARIAMLKQDYQVPVSRSIASIAAERALDVFAILGMALLSAWFALPGRMPPVALQLTVSVGVLFLAGLIGLLLVPKTEMWLRESGLLRRLIPLKLWNLYQKALDFGFALVNGVRMLGQRPQALLTVTLESFIIWLYDAVLLFCLLSAISVSLPHSAIIFTTMISDLSTAVPLTPGALGQFEVVMISLLTLFGISASASSLATILVRLVTLWTFIPVAGLITYIFGFSRILNLSSSDFGRPVSPSPVSTSAKS